MEITLKQRKLTTIGGSKGFIIPKPYIDNGQIEEEVEYELVIKKEGEKNEKRDKEDIGVEGQ